MRILFVSDAPWSTSGYGVQAGLLAPRLKQIGHEVAVVAGWGLGGAPIEWNGVTVFPSGLDPFGNDVIGKYASEWHADIVITLKDTFVYNPRAWGNVRWCPLTPVDHEPVPPTVKDTLRLAYQPIAYAPNGIEELMKAGFAPVYAPHAYAPSIYHPGDKREARRLLGWNEDALCFGFVGVNRGGYPSRKALPQILEAFALYKKRGGVGMLFMHTWMGMDGREQAVNLPLLIGQLSEDLNVDLQSVIAFTQPDVYLKGHSPETMRSMYQAMDVLLSVSLGEGFGVPNLEAQACGTPVIGSDWAALRDLVFGGWKIEKQNAYPSYSSQGAYQYLPSQAVLADTLFEAERAWKNKAVFASKQRDALIGAQSYQIEYVVNNHWRYVLDVIEQKIATEHVRGVVRVVRPEEVLA